MPETGRWLMLAAVITAIDQMTKAWAQLSLAAGPHALLPVLQLLLTYNSGAAFSLLAGAGGWQRALFSVIAVAAAGLIIVQLRRHRTQTVYCAGLALVLGGAIGNLIDRLLAGRVVDFIDAHWGVHHFPVFNMADCAITLGAGLLLWAEWRVSRPR